MRRRLIVVLVALLAVYLSGPFIDSGLYLARPHVRLIAWGDGLEGFGVCRYVFVNDFESKRRCE